MNKTTIFIMAMAFFLVVSPAAFAEKITVDVNGMICDFCAQSLNKIFDEQESVEKIDINLDAQTVTIFTHDGQDISDAKINELVYYAGYDVRAIHRE